VPVLLGVVIIGVDLITPPPILIGIFFVFPVLIAAWYNSLRWALVLSVSLPLARFLIATFVEPLWEMNYDIINAIDRIIVLSVVSLIAARLSDLVKHVKLLEGIIPICSWCKKIRDENEEWQPLERYITERSGSDFTHGICPDCAKILLEKHVKQSQA
jgi:hypothetical protein